jgi:hypothetical protein
MEGYQLDAVGKGINWTQYGRVSIGRSMEGCQLDSVLNETVVTLFYSQIFFSKSSQIPLSLR